LQKNTKDILCVLGASVVNVRESSSAAEGTAGAVLDVLEVDPAAPAGAAVDDAALLGREAAVGRELVRAAGGTADRGAVQDVGAEHLEPP
jgi:hypothetical protein